MQPLFLSLFLFLSVSLPIRCPARVELHHTRMIRDPWLDNDEEFLCRGIFMEDPSLALGKLVWRDRGGLEAFFRVL